MEQVKRKVMPCAVFNQPISYGNLHWKKKDCGVLPFNREDKSLMELIKNKAITLQPIDYFFPDFHIENGGKRCFTHIGNGIGDIFAFSALAEYLRDYPIQVHTMPFATPAYAWFKSKNVTIKEYYEPIAQDYTYPTRLTKFKGLRRLAIENAAVEARTGNWFDAHFQRIGIDKAPEGFDRPQLRSERGTDQRSLLVGKSVIISHKASCQMRSSSLEDFYYPVKNAMPGYQVYVHEVDLTEDDKRFIEQRGDILILPKDSLKNFLVNLWDADFVVSTDSSAAHFREGIGKPGVAVYGAMLAESRTRGYNFVKGFDTVTGCPFQPCVKHEKIKGEVCQNAEAGDRTARCQSGSMFQEQLYKEIKGVL